MQDDPQYGKDQRRRMRTLNAEIELAEISRDESYKTWILSQAKLYELKEQLEKVEREYPNGQG